MELASYSNDDSDLEEDPVTRKASDDFEFSAQEDDLDGDSDGSTPPETDDSDAESEDSAPRRSNRRRPAARGDEDVAEVRRSGRANRVSYAEEDDEEEAGGAGRGAAWEDGTADGAAKGAEGSTYSSPNEIASHFEIPFPSAFDHDSDSDGRGTKRRAEGGEELGGEAAGALPVLAKRARTGPPAVQIEKVIAIRPAQGAEGGEEVRVKLKGRSYREAEWLPAAEVERLGKGRLLHNLRSRLMKGIGGEEEAEAVDGVHPQWLEVDRVAASDGSGHYLVKWRGLGYVDCTWEREASLTSEPDIVAIQRFQLQSTYPDGAPPPDCPPDTLPTFLNGRTLRDYQATAVRWIVANRACHRNCVLGDEMGLGKTAQAIAVLEHQRQLGGKRGPFLIVAPLTTLGHWQREIQTWTDMNAVAWSGTQADRDLIQQYEFRFPQDAGRGKPAHYKFNVLLTSYEYCLRDAAVLRQIKWATIVIDEAHRMKSPASSTRLAIDSFQRAFLLLLTGTPVQNNLTELWGMLNMLDPHKYHSLEDFQEMYDGRPPTAQQIGALQEELKPRLLRRMKEDVEDLPQKQEVVIWVELTQDQRAYYKAIYEKQISSLMAGTSQKNLPQLTNLCMELRKVCDHPFLCNGVEEDTRARLAAASVVRSEAELLVAASGKMVLLAKLLPKLRAEGRKVLIFSQFKIMLDVLEDWLRLLRLPMERLDGNTPAAKRHASMERYQNDTEGKCFAFLLSTRAGGQGVTLTAADTIVIYDSDWNPQNDLQAMARAHRIGQTKDVTIYRLLARNTYEAHLFETASRKYGLDEAVLGGGAGPEGASGPGDGARIMQLLKHGAHAIFKEEEQASAAQAAFEAEGIDEILSSRTEARSIGGRAGNTFSVATFQQHDDLATPAAYWESMMPDAVAAAQAARAVEAKRLLLRRTRKVVDYSDTRPRDTRGGRGGSRGSDADDMADDYKPPPEELSQDGRPSTGRAGGPALAAGVKPWHQKELRALEEAVTRFGSEHPAAVHAEAVSQEPRLESRPVEQFHAALKAYLRLIATAATVRDAQLKSIDELIKALPPGEDAQKTELQNAGKAPPAGAFDAVLRDMPPECVKVMGGKDSLKRAYNMGQKLRTHLEEHRLVAATVRAGVFPKCSSTTGSGSKIPDWWAHEHDDHMLRGAVKHGRLLTRGEKQRSLLAAILSDSEGMGTVVGHKEQWGARPDPPAHLLDKKEWENLINELVKRMKRLVSAVVDAHKRACRPGSGTGAGMGSGAVGKPAGGGGGGKPGAALKQQGMNQFLKPKAAERGATGGPGVAADEDEIIEIESD